jgi:hypothetical protein
MRILLDSDGQKFLGTWVPFYSVSGVMDSH